VHATDVRPTAHQQTRHVQQYVATQLSPSHQYRLDNGSPKPAATQRHNYPGEACLYIGTPSAAIRCSVGCFCGRLRSLLPTAAMLAHPSAACGAGAVLKGPRSWWLQPTLNTACHRLFLSAALLAARMVSFHLCCLTCCCCCCAGGPGQLPRTPTALTLRPPWLVPSTFAVLRVVPDAPMRLVALAAHEHTLRADCTQVVVAHLTK
jgi:hypothetical protein